LLEDETSAYPWKGRSRQWRNVGAVKVTRREHVGQVADNSLFADDQYTKDCAAIGSRQ
jgi:hypothetical protein